MLIVLWIVVLVLMLEFVFIASADGMYIAAKILDILDSTTVDYLLEDDKAYRQVRAENGPPSTINTNRPERTDFEILNEVERRNFAKQRQEFIFLSDKYGNIKKIYAPDGTGEIAQIAKRLRVGGNLDSFLPPDMVIDALGAIREARNSYYISRLPIVRPTLQNEIFRDYNIPADGDKVHAIEFAVHASTQLRQRYFIFVGDSVFKRLYGTYRPHIYRDNWWWRNEFIRAELWTNSLGIRDDEVQLPKPKNVFRIVCIGGSTTVEGPHQDLTYPNMLERILRDRLDSDMVDVINCGVDGSTIENEYFRMDEFLALEPDLILHYNIINNMYAWLIDAVNRSEMLSGYWGAVRRAMSKSRLMGYLLHDLFLPPEIAVEERLGEAVEYLDKIRAICDTAGVAFAVSSFATPQAPQMSWRERVCFDRSFHSYPLVRATTRDYNRFMGIYNRMVKRFCEEKKLLYIPVAENFSGGADTFTDICHMRLRGIELKATIMADHLEAFVQARLEELQGESSVQTDSSL
jgi:hypothetical protein